MPKKLPELLSALEGKNILSLSGLAVLWGIQLLAFLSWGLSLFPVDQKRVWADFFTVVHPEVQPEREILLFRFFVLGTVAIFAFLLFRRLKNFPESLPSLTMRLMAEGLITISLVSSGLGWILAPEANEPKVMFYLMAALAMAAKFLPHASESVIRQIELAGARFKDAFKRWYGGDVLFLLWIFAAIAIVDVESVLALSYVQDKFHHWDGFVMAPGWAYLSGLVLNHDCITQYGIFCVAVLSRMAQWLGGFSYQHVLAVIAASTIIYYMVSYLFLRSWLKDSLLAASGIVLGLTWQMFHSGLESVIWRFPSATVIRYFFDVFIFVLILAHIRRGKLIFLYFAASLAGVSLAHVTDTGIYVTLTLWAYLILETVRELSGKNFFKSSLYRMIACAILPLMVAAAILGWMEGPWFFSAEFWNNSIENIRLFLRGFGNLPIYTNLKEGFPGLFLLGLAIPLIYVLNLMVIGSLYISGKLGKEHVLAILLSIYGLGLYHYYVCRSAIMSYLVVSLPLVFILCYWMQALLENLDRFPRRIMTSVVLFLLLVQLFSNPIFQKYPNIFHSKAQLWAEEKAQFEKEFHFQSDEALIREMTRPEERVALISSFETQILIEAQRRPYFYYFPLINSERMEVNSFQGTYLWEKSRLDKTLMQLQQHSPQYIFVEKKLFEGKLPRPYYAYHETLTILMQFLYEHYEPVKSGKYLLALKRKPL